MLLGSFFTFNPLHSGDGKIANFADNDNYAAYGRNKVNHQMEVFKSGADLIIIGLLPVCILAT